MGKTLLRWFAVGLFVGLGAGAVVGLTLSRGINLPAVEALTSFRPAAATQVRAKDGSLLATFSREKRIPLPAEQIPAVFRNAVIASEDANFYRHTGVDPRGIVRAVLRNFISFGSSTQGASTITQQLARGLFLSPEKKLIRKVKEALLAIEIEQRFSKDEILALYINQVYFGHGTYGVEAAARFFFGKPAAQLTVPEAALLAGIVQRNDAQSPIRQPARALARRSYVLARMHDEGMLTRDAYEAARSSPLGVKAHYDRTVSAAYFVEEVRRTVEDRFGSKEMLEGGLEVATTLDPALQTIAEGSVRDGLVELQRRLGWPGARRNLLADKATDAGAWRDPSWRFLRWQRGELAYAVVEEVRAELATLRIGDRTARLVPAGAKWTGRTNLTRLCKPGDVLLVRLYEVPPQPDLPLSVELEGEPSTESAMLVLDNRTGAILALVGGFDFERSEWDRAMQAARQCGSAFKPFVYIAAFERGFAPNDLILDAPVLLPDERLLPTYCPLNYYLKFEGMVTLRYALEHSLNASATKLQQLVTGEAVIDAARRLGIRQTLAPVSSLALGSFEVTLLELASAYSGIANRGQVAEPYFITTVRSDQGQTLLDQRPKVRQAVREEVAYMVTQVLHGVVVRGTAVAARELPGHLAGKTGTTDRFTDAWFIGYTPRITCAVWVGRDVKSPIGRKMSGAEAALPTWMRFMRAYLDRAGAGVVDEDFPVPAGIAMVAVDQRTGMRANPDCGADVILEALPEERQVEECTPRMHQLVAQPWVQQLPYYVYRPGEPVTTPESIAAAAAKITTPEEERDRPEPSPTAGEEPVAPR
jgi:penicillin-binding protein 1A